MVDLKRVIKSSSHGRSRCPTINGSRICNATLPIPEIATSVPCAPDNKLTSKGVSSTPNICDAEADATAAGTLPLAIATKAIDDCTVDGKAARNNMPVHNAGDNVEPNSADNARPSSGNITKVHASTRRCSRQCVSPAITELRA